MPDTLQIQSYLQNHSLDDLKAEHGVNFRFGVDHPELVGLKYGHDVDFSDPIVQECRGLVLNKDTLDVVSFPYRKFFNYMDPLGAKVDWGSARAYEKLDGALMTLYPYDGGWIVSTSGSPDGEVMVPDTGVHFNEAFWQAWDDLGYRPPKAGGKSYMFELISPLFPVVVKYGKDPRIVLHGVRDLETHEEEWPEGRASENAWECVKRHSNIHGVEQAAEAVRDLDPARNEGLVACDADFNRLKVKSPQFLSVFYLKSMRSKKSLIRLVMADARKALSSFPEYLPLFDEVRKRYLNLIDELEGGSKNLGRSTLPADIDAVVGERRARNKEEALALVDLDKVARAMKLDDIELPGGEPAEDLF